MYQGRKLTVGIIGAGPAGLMAARELARLGHRPTVFEAHPEIGVPVRCGEGLIDLYRAYEQDPPGARVKIREICVRLNALHAFPVGNLNIWLLDKDRWLQSMASEFESLGGRISLEARAQVSQLRKQFDFVLDCSGCPSQSAKEYGIWAGAHALAIQYTVRADVAKLLGKLYFHLKPGESGYRWLFPKSAKKANIGIGWAKSPPGKRWAMLDAFASETLGKFQILRKVAGYIPQRIASPLQAENLLLCGDAAGIVNPYSGAGIHTALLSGALAAKCLAEGHAMLYPRQLISAIDAEFKVARFARSLLEASFSHHEKAVAYLERRFSLGEIFTRDTYRRLSPQVHMWKLRTLLLGHRGLAALPFPFAKHCDPDPEALPFIATGHPHPRNYEPNREKALDKQAG